MSRLWTLDVVRVVTESCSPTVDLYLCLVMWQDYKVGVNRIFETVALKMTHIQNMIHNGFFLLSFPLSPTKCQ